MLVSPLTVIDIQGEIQGVGTYKNIPVALLNDHVVRLSVMTEAYHWHYHPNSDETFLVIEGVVCIELEKKNGGTSSRAAIYHSGQRPTPYSA